MFNFLKHIKIFSITFLVLLALLSFSNYASAVALNLPSGASGGASGDEDKTKTNADVFEGVFCNVFKVAKNIGKPLLLLIIVFIAALAYFGKVQLVAIIMIIVGAAVFFGAPTIVKLVTGSDTNICTGTYKIE